MFEVKSLSPRRVLEKYVQILTDFDALVNQRAAWTFNYKSKNTWKYEKSRENKKKENIKKYGKLSANRNQFIGQFVFMTMKEYRSNFDR